MAVMETSLFERLGGKEKLETALHHFHRHLVADEEMAPFFAGRDMAKHLEQQLNFIARVSGGPTSCKCKCGKGNHHQEVMKKSHSELNINGSQFVRFMELLVLALQEADVPDEAIQELAAKLEELKGSIVTVL